jgi:hypothetical protein
MGEWLRCNSRLPTYTASQMSASQAHALDAIAFQLVAALEAYDRDAGRLVASWPDPELYRSVSDQVDRIRMYSSALPQTRVQWVEVLISHAELVHGLWRAQPGLGDDVLAQVASVRARHSAAIAALRTRCIRGMRVHRTAA